MSKYNLQIGVVDDRVVVSVGDESIDVSDDLLKFIAINEKNEALEGVNNLLKLERARVAERDVEISILQLKAGMIRDVVSRCFNEY